MRLGTAIERLVEAYNYASDKDWIMDKVAWALYQTWKVADRKTEPQTEMAEDIVRSYGFKAESYRQAKAKTEQTEREGE